MSRKRKSKKLSHPSYEVDQPVIYSKPKSQAKLKETISLDRRPIVEKVIDYINLKMTEEQKQYLISRIK